MGNTLKNDDKYDGKLKQACQEAINLGVNARIERKKEKKNQGNLKYDNPDVGAVFLDKDGDIISSAYRHEINNFHAEVSAIAKLFRDGRADCLDKIDTVISTLEPCSVRPGHTNKEGRVIDKTFPCAKYLIYYGVKKVYIGDFDSSVIMRGRGVNLLYDHGDYYHNTSYHSGDDIEIHTFLDKDLRDKVKRLNKEYNEYSQHHATKLFKRWKSVMEENRNMPPNDYKEIVTALRGVPIPSVENLPSDFLNIINEHVSKIASDVKEILHEFRTEFDFVTMFKVKYSNMLNDIQIPDELISPMKYTLKDILAIHFMINKNDSNLDDQILYEIALYIYRLNDKNNL